MRKVNGKDLEMGMVFKHGDIIYEILNQRDYNWHPEIFEAKIISRTPKLGARDVVAFGNSSDAWWDVLDEEEIEQTINLLKLIN